MPKFSTQFAIIEHIKNFINKSGRPWRNRDESSEISAEIAKRIQKKNYERSLKGLDNTTYPPYLRIAEQLQVNNEQIFCAAVFQLTETARNIKRYRSNIIRILEQARNNADLNDAQRKALDNALKDLA